MSMLLRLLVRPKVVPIELPLPLLPKMLESIEQQTCGALLIAGTAGDGKPITVVRCGMTLVATRQHGTMAARLNGLHYKTGEKSILLKT